MSTSKVMTNRESSAPAVHRIRGISAGKLKEEFRKRATDDTSGNTDGKHYDMRTVSINDERLYPFIFSKTLKHDAATGLPRESDVNAMLEAVTTASPATADALSSAQSDSTTRGLVSVSAGLCFTLEAGDPKLVGCSPPAITTSLDRMFEMCEVYQLGILRDTPLAVIAEGTDSTVVATIAALNAFPAVSRTTSPSNASGNIDGKTLFRGKSTSLQGNNPELYGPYVSQLLLHDFDIDNKSNQQKIRPEQNPNNQITNAGFLSIQNGEAGPAISFESESKYVYNLRVNGSLVHNDSLFTIYTNAAHVLLQNGVQAIGINDIRTTSSTKPDPFSSFVALGDPDVFSSIASVAGKALYTAFNQKWCMNMTIRPEAMANLITRTLDGTFDSTNFPELTEFKSHINGAASQTLATVLSSNQAVSPGNADYATHNLNGLFPEGSPTHPSYPAGHAVVAGACATVLKAMLKTTDVIGDTLTEKLWVADGRTSLISTDGLSLDTYQESDAGAMTVNGEINKLASNVALGRDSAGVHYRIDGDRGKEIGEDVAINFLKDKSLCYYQSTNGQFAGFVLVKFDGTSVIIRNGNIEPYA